MCTLMLVALVQDHSDPAWRHLQSDDCSGEFGKAIWTLGDLWRRLCLEVHGTPHTSFGLYGLPLEEFLDSLRMIQKEHQTCRECLDTEFTEVILQQFAPLLQPAAESDEHASIDRMSKLVEEYHAIQDVMGDVATVLPISSDLVECVHGEVQRKLHERRRAAKILKASSMESFLNSIKRSHRSLVEWIKPSYLPPNPGKILAASLKSKKSKSKGNERYYEQQLECTPSRHIRSLSGCLSRQ